MGHNGNTGDGILMASEVGAALWHMWHLHGSYGFKLPHLPVAIRSPLGGARDPARPLHWIILDQRGKRFTNELPPAPQDTLSRPLAHLDPESGCYDRIPAWLIFDERGRRAGPLGRPVGAQGEHRYTWSRDNLAEVEQGWIVQAPGLDALAERTDLPAETLRASVARWNASVAAGQDADFSRPPGTMVSIAESPFYAIQVWPVVSNTQGGPVHDERQRVIDVRGRPIPGLFAVGELGSFFGHIYLLGGNITEGIVGGRNAGREAARAALAPSAAGAVPGASR
jgi:succinate dehydrogenase/fumarate reductase flavoprotein subunit